MIEFVRLDTFALIYFAGIVILSLNYYFVYDRFEEKRWVQIIFGIAFLSYVGIGAMNNLLLHIIAGIFLTYFICFPIRYLWMVLLDAVHKKDPDEITTSDEQFDRLTPEEQLTSLRKHIKSCEREILKKQTMRSLAYLLLLMVLLVFAAGAVALFIAATAYTYIILGCILLFILCFEVHPRRASILIKFVMKYALNSEINEAIRLLENDKYNNQLKYEQLELGNNMEIKEQVMQRLRF